MNGCRENPGQTDERTDERTNGRTGLKTIVPFDNVGGLKILPRPRTGYLGGKFKYQRQENIRNFLLK